MSVTQQYPQDAEPLHARRTSQTADDESLQRAYTNRNYNAAFYALIDQVKGTTCSHCELACGDSVARAGYTDLPVFYCEAFCDAYFAEADALSQESPIGRELWARARMWKARLFHTPLLIGGQTNGGSCSEWHAIRSSR